MRSVRFRNIRKIKFLKKHINRNQEDFLQIFKLIQYLSLLFGTQKCKLKEMKVLPMSNCNIILSVIMSIVLFVTSYFLLTIIGQATNYSHIFIIYLIVYILYIIYFLVVVILNVYYSKDYVVLITNLQIINSSIKDEKNNKRTGTTMKAFVIIQCLVNVIVLIGRLCYDPFSCLSKYICTTIIIVFEIDMLCIIFIVRFLYVKVNQINEQVLAYITHPENVKEFVENELLSLLKRVLDSISILQTCSRIQVTNFIM